MNDHIAPPVDDRPQQPWHSWASPVGLGIGLLCILGSFALLAAGLMLLSSI